MRLHIRRRLVPGRLGHAHDQRNVLAGPHLGNFGRKPQPGTSWRAVVGLPDHALLYGRDLDPGLAVDAPARRDGDRGVGVEYEFCLVLAPDRTFDELRHGRHNLAFPERRVADPAVVEVAD
jgi:hypothetical protein